MNANKNANNLYDDKFYDRYDKPVWKQDDVYVANWIDKNLKGKTIGDLGCGKATIISELKNKGWNVWGLDVSDSFKSHVPQNVKNDVRQADLSSVLELPRADVAMSLEVAEHLPKGSQIHFVENLMKPCPDTIMMTVATPGQESRYHFNIQPRRVWIEEVEKRGYKENEALEYRFKYDMDGKLKVKTWYSWNILIFNKAK